jgi:hypothetical protein
MMGRTADGNSVRLDVDYSETWLAVLKKLVFLSRQDFDRAI